MWIRKICIRVSFDEIIFESCVHIKKRVILQTEKKKEKNYATIFNPDFYRKKIGKLKHVHSFNDMVIIVII